MLVYTVFASLANILPKSNSNQTAGPCLPRCPKVRISLENAVKSFKDTLNLVIFSCRFSMMEAKRVEFQFEVEGMQDLELEEEKSLNATVQEFKEQSKG